MLPWTYFLWPILHHIFPEDLEWSEMAQSYKPRIKNIHSEYPLEKYYSTSIQAPVVKLGAHGPECNDGKKILFTPRGWKVDEPGPMILDANGQLIWTKYFENEFGGHPYDLKVQRYRGEDYLTFWLGDDRVRGHGAGHFYLLNSSYDVVQTLGAKNSLYADLHELIITPEGTAMLFIFQPTSFNLKPMGRKFNDLWNQAIWDCVLQEFDVETGDLLFEWRASEHVNMTSTYAELSSTVGEAGTQADPFDFIHTNSVQKDSLGNYLISARHMHAIYYIDGKTKQTLWTLGGKDNVFQDHSQGHVLNIAWQHGAHFIPVHSFPNLYEPPEEQKGWTTQLLTIFDNAAMDWNYTYGSPESRALLLELTYPTPHTHPQARPSHRFGTLKSGTPPPKPLSTVDSAKVASINGTKEDYTVRLVQRWIHPEKLICSTQGGMQLLSPPSSPSGSAKEDPNIFVGYGINAVMTQYASNGTVQCDWYYGTRASWETGNVQSYRAAKQAWIGRPRTAPDAVWRKEAVYVSWNGATECVAWRIEKATDEGGTWVEIKRAEKRGFETAISLEEVGAFSSGTRLRVVALGENGDVLPYGTSAVLTRGLFAALAVLPESDSGFSWLVAVTLLLVVAVFAFRRFVALRRRRERGVYLSRRRVD